jgi:hypothetical protein
VTSRASDIDFNAQPGAEKPVILHLAQLAWIAEHSNVCCFGPPGSWFTPAPPASVVDQSVQPRCGDLDGEPSSTAARDLDGLKFAAALDLVQSWRAQPSKRAASLRATNPAATSGTKRRRVSPVRRMRQGACGVVCWRGAARR